VRENAPQIRQQGRSVATARYWAFDGLRLGDVMMIDESGRLLSKDGQSLPAVLPCCNQLLFISHLSFSRTTTLPTSVAVACCCSTSHHGESAFSYVSWTFDARGLGRSGSRPCLAHFTSQRARIRLISCTSPRSTIPLNSPLPFSANSVLVVRLFSECVA
jgi:hypothetical protein